MLLFYLLLFIKFVSLTFSSGLDNDLLEFGFDNSLYFLKASEDASFARYRPSMPLTDLQLENDIFSNEEEPSSTMPLVVVAIPTFNLHHLLLKSLEYVARQKYPRDRIHVAILDDSSQSLEYNEEFLNKVQSLNELGVKLHYKHRNIISQIGQENLGERHNSMVKWIKKDLIKNEKDFIIIHWNVADWQAPHRILKQVLPLINGQSHMSALDLRNVMVLNENQIYSKWGYDGKRKPMPIMDINSGTLCYWASLWNNNTQFSNLGHIEDIIFINNIISSNHNESHHVTILDDSDISVINTQYNIQTWNHVNTSWIPIPISNLPLTFKRDYKFYKEIQHWKNLQSNTFSQKNQEYSVGGSNINQIKTIVVNEIRGLTR